MSRPLSVFRSVAALAALSLLGSPAMAAIQEEIPEAAVPTAFGLPSGEAILPVQARLRQAGAVPGALQTIEFRLYAGESATTPVWGESIAVLLDTNGVFNVLLREGLGAKLVTGRLSDAIRAHAAEPLFLGITPGTNGELSPRMPIRVQGHARHAAFALGSFEDFESLSNTLSCVDFRIGTGGSLEAAQGDLQGLVTCDSLEAGSQQTHLRGNAVLQGRVNEVSGGTVRAKNGFTGRGSVPVGTVIAWHGHLAEMPEGWALCDGKEGRPDLRDRFVRSTGANGAARGSDPKDLNQPGGQNSVSLQAEHLPPHVHSLQRISPKITDTDYMWVATKDSSSDKFWGGKQMTITGISEAPNTGLSPYVSNAHENRPPFHGLYYIIRIQ